MPINWKFGIICWKLKQLTYENWKCQNGNKLGISTLARQMYPKQQQFLMEAFNDATAEPYGHLWIDCHPLTPEEMRLRSKILPQEKQIVYVKRI